MEEVLNPSALAKELRIFSDQKLSSWIAGVCHQHSLELMASLDRDGAPYHYKLKRICRRSNNPHNRINRGKIRFTRLGRPHANTNENGFTGAHCRSRIADELKAALIEVPAGNFIQKWLVDEQITGIKLTNF